MAGLSEEKRHQMDEELRILARDNYDLFIKIVGVDPLKAYIGLERYKGRSYGYIARITGLKEERVAARCRKVFKK